MNIECKRCGACCLHMCYPHFRPEELDSLPGDIRQVVEWFQKNDYDRRGHYTPCYFFNLRTRKCLIQEHKSMVCKQFEPGSDDCKHFRAKFLPGLNHLNEVLT